MRSLPWLLMIVGAMVILAGAFVALSSLSSLYQGAIDDPMSQPETAEQDASRMMLRGAAIGAPGALLMLTGKVMLARRNRAERRANPAP